MLLHRHKMPCQNHLLLWKDTTPYCRQFFSIARNPMNKDVCIFIQQTTFFKNFRKRFLSIDEFKFLVHKEFFNCMSIIRCLLPCELTGIENIICPSFVKFLVLAENVFLLGEPQLSKISCDGPFGINILSTQNWGKVNKNPIKTTFFNIFNTLLNCGICWNCWSHMQFYYHLLPSPFEFFTVFKILKLRVYCKISTS